MIINNTEFGAPWNDQCYTVRFYLTGKYEHVMFTSNDLFEEMCLPGPKRYTEDELSKAAKERITEIYSDLLNFDSFIIHIVKIS